MTTAEKLKEEQWVAYREGEAIAVFENRREAVKYLKELLNQTLKDFDKQDKTDEYDYNIEIKRIVIEPIKLRATYLGL